MQQVHFGMNSKQVESTAVYIPYMTSCILLTSFPCSTPVQEEPGNGANIVTKLHCICAVHTCIPGTYDVM